MMVASEARINGLTDRERRFAELWVADPEHNGTRAAREAGYKGSENTLASVASENLRKPKIQNYLAELRGEAIQQAEAETAGTVATLKDALKHASAMIQLDVVEVLGDDGEVDVERLRSLPPEQRKVLQVEIQSTTNEEGQVFARQKIKRDPTALAAAKVIVEHYEGAKKPEGSGNTYVLNLNGMDPETLRKLYSMGWLNGEAKRLTEGE